MSKSVSFDPASLIYDFETLILWVSSENAFIVYAYLSPSLFLLFSSESEFELISLFLPIFESYWLCYSWIASISAMYVNMNKKIIILPYFLNFIIKTYKYEIIK